MIDIESIITNAVIEALSTTYPSATVYSRPVESTETFPTVTVQEINNITYTRTQDEANHEHHARVAYQVDVYTVGDNAKRDAKGILDIVNGTLEQMNFTRVTYSRTPNMDRTVFRLTARYEGVVEEPVTDSSGNLTYMVYRK